MKKLLSVLLVLSMLLTVFAFVGCGEEEEIKEVKKQTSSDDDIQAALEKGDIFAERAVVDDGLDDTLDFGGKTLRVVCHNDGYEMFPAAEDINKGDLIKDAKAARNKVVEDKLNCKIELVYNAGITELQSHVSKTVLSGSDEFDLLVVHVNTSAQMITKNLFLNWYDVPHVDFSKPWWSPTNTTELTYDGKCIFAISDLNATAILCSRVLFFNKALANSWDLGNLYELVLNGDWTYDEFYSRIKDIYTDADGSGDRSTGDFYGAVLDIEKTDWLTSFNNPVIKKDADGIPAISIKTDKINNIVQAIYDLYRNTNGTWYVAYEDEDSVHKYFVNRQAIFIDTYLNSVCGTLYRNFEDDYGILPAPKWNEYQDNYYIGVYPEHTVSSIPKTAANNLEFIGACAEALSYESWKTLTPTIYEIALKTRYLRDNESKDVLDIVLDNRVFNFGTVYGTGGLGGVDRMAVRNNNPNFESFYSKNYGNARIALKKVLKVFDKL